MTPLVQKYGGSSLATPEHIKAIAKKLALLHSRKRPLIVVLSAIGKTTDELLDLSYRVARRPNRRELDMLLSTGERVSTALMSMSLNDIGIPAISFTGSQGGLITDNSHNNARVLDIRPYRIEAALEAKQVVILAGFQGVTGDTKEITTLGRGGSDTTAVAMAAYFKAKQCEIYKDVDGVFSADPNSVDKTRQLPRLTYENLMEMTFWGAQVMHYRSVELAKTLDIPIFIGLAHGQGTGTLIGKDNDMYEKQSILSVNSHTDVRILTVLEEDLGQALSRFHGFLKSHQLPWPQLLDSQKITKGWNLLVTGPAETLQAIDNLAQDDRSIHMLPDAFSSVTATCQGAYSSDLPEKLTKSLSDDGIMPEKILFGAVSVTAIVRPPERAKAIQSFHRLV